MDEDQLPPFEVTERLYKDMGRLFAVIYTGMIEGGLTDKTASYVLGEYANGMAMRVEHNHE